jgi:hypothetical protein
MAETATMAAGSRETVLSNPWNVSVRVTRVADSQACCRRIADQVVDRREEGKSAVQLNSST